MQTMRIVFFAAAVLLGLAAPAFADTTTDTSTDTGTSVTPAEPDRTPASVIADTHNPDHQSELQAFDWQRTWGSIHLNSYADGVGDPGSPATSTGQVPCLNFGAASSNICYITNVTDSKGRPADNPSLNAYVPKFEISGGTFPNASPIVVNGKTVLTNAIKYDIKNSVVNCMAKAVPNWAIQHGGPAGAFSYQVSVCSSLSGAVGKTLTPNYGQGAPTTANYGPKLYFFPFWDPRTNDLQTTDFGAKPGCMQQITNTCGNQTLDLHVRDIHDCANTNPSKFYVPKYENGVSTKEPFPLDCKLGSCDGLSATHPVTHIFSKNEKEDLGLTTEGAPLPTVYWVYDKKDSTSVGHHRALSATDPTGKSEVYSGGDAIPIQKVNNVSDPTLARLKSFSLSVKKTGNDGSQSFIIMDPSDFFDLRLYTNGGKYDSGYASFVDTTKYPKFAPNTPATPDTCPVMGITGYSGICDPNGVAGCNLPIYGIGPTTEFTDEAGQVYSYSPATVTWSGYVKSWEVISMRTYLSDIRGRDDIYFTPDDGTDIMNDNPILKITRSKDYCEDPELTSADHLSRRLGPDLETCTQYLQFVQTDEELNAFHWMDLYFAPPDTDPMTDKARMDTMRTYGVKKNLLTGKFEVDFDNPVKGTSTDDRYLDKDHPRSVKTGYVTLMDDTAHTPTAKYFDARDGQHHEAVSHAAPVKSGPDQDGHTIQTIGKYVNGVDNKAGVFMDLEKGNKAVLRMPNDLVVNGKKTTCAFIDTGNPSEKDLNGAVDAPRVFIPTNSMAEAQHFIDEVSAKDGKPAYEGVSVRDCAAKFAENTTDGLPLKPDNSNKRHDAKGKTWYGKLTCAELIGDAQPSCNQTKRISLERMCQYENGMFGDCDSCQALAEPEDKSMYSLMDKFHATGEQPADMSIMVAPLASGTKGDRCRFLASCFAINSKNGGCPSDGTVGGHVFCFSGETKITMADGTQKEIKKIKAGEKVKSFNARNSRNAALDAAKIKATAVTKKQKVIAINDLRITPLHKVVLANGRAVEAQKIKVGDKILRADGMVEEVTSVKTDLKPVTVYNLVLENGQDGYIAGGVRVMSYPTPKGMDKVADRHNGRGGRGLSSVKAPQK